MDAGVTTVFTVFTVDLTEYLDKIAEMVNGKLSSNSQQKIL
jgi:hypothetical protein